jgi:hypothetical protein
MPIRPVQRRTQADSEHLAEAAAGGDRGHLDRLLNAWARDTEEPVTSGRLRSLVGVTAIIQMLDGLKDEEGRERIAFKDGAYRVPPFLRAC